MVNTVPKQLISFYISVLRTLQENIGAMNDVNVSSKDAMLNARQRQGRSCHSPFYSDRVGFLESEDAVAVTCGVCRGAKIMSSYSLVQATIAMPLPDTSGEREQAASCSATRTRRSANGTISWQSCSNPHPTITR